VRAPVWVALDTETTGLEPGSRLVELGAVAFTADGLVLDTFETPVNPGMPMPADAVAVNGFEDQALAAAPPAARVLREFVAWLPRGARLVAHNAAFDQGILGWELDRARLAWPEADMVDSCLLARALGDTCDNRLETLIRHHGWPRHGRAHRALSDAHAVRRLVLLARRRGLNGALLTGQPFRARYRCPRTLPPRVAPLPAAVSAGARVALRYVDAAGIRSDREVTPFGYAQRDETLVWHGWCHLRAARRSFVAERVRALRLTG
jgi:DNA polymerase-3 subunit epsilon